MANAFAHLLVAALGEVAGAGAEGGFDGCVGSHPVGEGIFAVLDDAGVIESMAVKLIGRWGALTPC